MWSSVNFATLHNSQGDIEMADEKDQTDTDDQKDLTDAVRSVLRKAKGDAGAAVERLLEENFQARADRREARKALEDYKKKFPEDSVVATAEQAEVLEVLKARKLDTVEKVEKEFAKATELQGKLDTVNREVVINEIARLHGFPADTLRDMVTARNLTPTIEDQDVEVVENGVKAKKKVKMGYVTTTDADAKPMLFTEYVTGTDYERMLDPEEIKVARRRVAGQTDSVRVKDSGTPSIVETILQRNAARAGAANALRPAKS